MCLLSLTQIAWFPDLDILYSILHEAHRDLTRFDVYKSEIEAGHLQWGLVHTEKFFKENAKLMEGPNGDFAIVQVRLLQFILGFVITVRSKDTNFLCI